MVELVAKQADCKPQREQSARILVRGRFSDVRVRMSTVPDQDELLKASIATSVLNSPRSARKTLALMEGPTVLSETTLEMAVTPMSFAELQARNVGGIGTSIVIVTEDDLLLTSELPKKHAERPGGVIQPIGGYPEVKADVFKPDCEPDLDNNGVWDPFKTIRREVREETGIDDLKDLFVIGAVHNNYSRQPILVFSGRTSYTSEQVDKLPSEPVPLRFIDNTVESVSAFLERPCGFSPTGLTSMLLHGSNAFGADWYHQEVAEIKRTTRIHESLSPDAHEDVRHTSIAYTLSQAQPVT